MTAPSMLTRSAVCVSCGATYDAPTVNGRRVSVVCSDKCYFEEKRRRGLFTPSPHAAPKRRWLAVCPPRYANFDPEKLPAQARSIAAAVLAYSLDITPHHGVAIVGPSDRGKSMLIHEAARQVFEKGCEVFVTCAADFAWKIEHLNERRDFLNRCLHARLLVFDDLGKSRLTERVEADFFHLLDHRERWGLPILWSANSKGQQLRACMSADRAEPILNRLRRSAQIYSV